jgi:hypothetical protein
LNKVETEAIRSRCILGKNQNINQISVKEEADGEVDITLGMDLQCKISQFIAGIKAIPLSIALKDYTKIYFKTVINGDTCNYQVQFEQSLYFSLMMYNAWYVMFSI